MGTPKAPQPEDPAKTAAAQTATNIGTSIANTVSGQVNRQTPDGNLTYKQTGNYVYRDPNTGRRHNIPTYTAIETLSPEDYRIRWHNKRAEENLAGTANDQSAFLREYLSEPIDLSAEALSERTGMPTTLDTTAIEDRLSELGRARLDPDFARNEEILRTRLANQGLQPGSVAHDRAMEEFYRSKNDQYNQLYLTGRGQAFNELVTGRNQAINEITTERNQPLNEIIAMLSGTQVQAPNFDIATPASIPTVDYAGLVNQNYAQEMAAYNQKLQNRNALYGGLFGAGGKIASAGIGAL